MIVLWIVFPILSIISIVCLVLAILSLKHIRRSEATRNWIAVNAHVDHVGVEPRKGDDDEVMVRYSYTVGRKIYTGTGLHLNMPISSKHSGPLLEKLRGCEVVLARYNPQDPGEAYLLTGSLRSEWAFFWGVLFFLSLSILIEISVSFAYFGSADYASAITVVR